MDLAPKEESVIASTTLITPFTLTQEMKGERDAASQYKLRDLVFSEERCVGVDGDKVRLWRETSERSLNLNFIRVSMREELLSLWGLSEIHDERAQHYYAYEVTPEAHAWIFEGVHGYSSGGVTWKPQRINAFVTRRGIGLISITGFWVGAMGECRETELNQIAAGQWESTST